MVVCVAIALALSACELTGTASRDDEVHNGASDIAPYGREHSSGGDEVTDSRARAGGPAGAVRRPTTSGPHEADGVACTVTVDAGDSIQAALDRLSEGGTVCLATGVWEETLTVRGSAAIVGVAGRPALARIVAAGEDDAVVTIDADADAVVRLAHLIAQGRDEPHPSASMPADGDGPVGIDVVSGGRIDLDNVELAGIPGHALVARGTSTVRVSGGTISRNGGGILATDASEVRLTATRIANNADSGIEASLSGSVALTDCAVIANGNGVVVADSAAATVRGSTVEDSAGCGVRVTSPESTVDGGGNDMTGNAVDLCGYAPSAVRNPLVASTGAASVAVPGDFGSLQEAIDAVTPGGTISLAAGTYEEGVTIWKPVTIAGASSDETLITRPKHGDAFTDIADAVPTVSVIADARGVTVADATIAGGGGASLLVFGEVQLEAARVTGSAADGIAVLGDGRLSGRGIAVTDHGRAGLAAADRAHVTLSDRSRIADNAGDGMSITGTGVFTLTRSAVSDNGSDGLSVGEAPTVELDDVDVTGNADEGVILAGATVLAARDSRVSANGDKGIIAFGDAQLDVIDCAIDDNGMFGVVVFGTSVARLQDVSVSRNGADGLQIGVRGTSSQPRLTLTRGVVEGNGTGGLMVGGRAEVQVQHVTVNGSGSGEECGDASTLCNGVTATGGAVVVADHLVITDNADWGIAAERRACTYASDVFTGTVSVDVGSLTLVGNNGSKALVGTGNPGAHGVAGVPDGQICLP